MTVERRDGTGKAMLVLPVCEAIPEWLGAESSDATVLRLGPRRWLVISDDRAGSELVAAWQSRLVGTMHLLEDASDRFVALRVTEIQRLSEQLTQPIDALTPGSATRTLLGDVPVICHRRADCVDVLVDRSYAHYAQAWLEQTLAKT
jgi:heterotetrameric sarcosine oxidase gamma subunit